MSESKVGGLCTYCALLCCNKCQTLDHFCHGHEFGRTVCSFHSKHNKTLLVNNNRVLAYIGTDENRSINHKSKNLVQLSTLSSLFKIFYNELDVYFLLYLLYYFFSTMHIILMYLIIEI